MCFSGRSVPVLRASFIAISLDSSWPYLSPVIAATSNHSQTLQRPMSYIQDCHIN